MLPRSPGRIIASSLLLAVLAAPVLAATGEDKPNVVILLADDLGYGDLACYGGWVPMPNLEKMAGQGVLFTQAYAPAPVCTPSRAGLFTGQYPARVGVQCNLGDNKVARKHARGLATETVTMPERLHALGYHTGLIGKWHLGLKSGLTPIDQGFDEFFGFLGATHLYLPSDEDAKMLRGETPEPEHEKEYLTDALARESEAFLARNKDKPFVLTVAFNAPHSPYQATDAYLARFPDMKEERRTYAAMLAALDDAIGRILAALEKNGLAEKTLVFFASDNGAPLDEGKGSNGAFAQGKAFLFEGGNRVPMIVHWPGHGTAGSKIASPVSLLDITATTLRLAGATPEVMSEMDGLDLAPLLAGEKPPARTFYWKLGSSAAILADGWKLVTSKESRWLFHLDVDSEEKLDVLDQEPERAGALGKDLAAWIAKLPAPLWKNEEFGAPIKVRGKAYFIEY